MAIPPTGLPVGFLATDFMTNLVFINIGQDNIVSVNNIVTISNVDSAPIKRIMQEAKSKGTCIDCTRGKKIKSVIITTTGSIILSAIQPQTLLARIEKKTNMEDESE